MRAHPVTRSIPGMWRWRRNPLRRRSDVVEAWTDVTAVLLAAVAAPVAGVAAGHAVDTGLHRVVVAQHAARREVSAVVQRADRGHDVLVDPADDEQSPSHAVLVSWRAVDGVRHTAVVTVAGHHSPGTRVPLWTDRHGHPAPAPLDGATATSNAVAAGFGSAVAVAALVLAARHLLGWRTLRRRMADWEREWTRVSQDWAGAEG